MNASKFSNQYGELLLIPVPKVLNLKLKQGHLLVSWRNPKTGIIEMLIAKASALDVEFTDEELLEHGYKTPNGLLSHSIKTASFGTPGLFSTILYEYTNIDYTKMKRHLA